jgi:hypothetical protein
MRPDEEPNDELAETPRKRRLIIVSILLPMVLLLGLMVFLVLQPGGDYYLASRGSNTRIPIDRAVAEPVFLGVIGLFLLVVVRAGWAGLRNAGTGTDAAVQRERLALGEPVRWTGRPLWRSFRGPRVVGVALAVLVPALLLWWTWRIWTSDNLLIAKLFFTLFPAFFMFTSVIPILINTSDMLGDCWRDVFGTVAITDRRIVWLTPFRREVYRQIAGRAIVEAHVSPPGATRGTLTLMKRNDEDIEYAYIDGLPDPDRALDAAKALIHPASTPF